MTTPRLLMLLGDALPVLAVVTETDTRTGKVTHDYVRTRRDLALSRRGVHYARKHKPWLIRTITLTSRGKGTLKAFDVAPDRNWPQKIQQKVEAAATKPKAQELGSTAPVIDGGKNVIDQSLSNEQFDFFGTPGTSGEIDCLSPPDWFEKLHE